MATPKKTKKRYSTSYRRRMTRIALRLNWIITKNICQIDSNLLNSGDSLLDRVFPKYTKLAILAFLFGFNFENEMSIVISHFNLNSKHHDNYEFAVTCIPLESAANLLPLEIVQICQLRVLRENSSVQSPLAATMARRQSQGHLRLLTR